jgi:hypothetical protein
MKEPSYVFPPPFRVIPPEIVDLLGEPGQVFDGMEEDCLGCGIVQALGVARSGKTTWAYLALDWVIAYTKRPIYFANLPQIIIDEGIPDHWKGRVFTKPADEIHKVPASEMPVWVIDDASAHHSSRSSMNKKGMILAKTAPVISHLNAAIIYTTQSLAAVDRSFFRFTETVMVVRYMNQSGMRGERDEWREDVEHAQYLLRRAHAGLPGRRMRSYYVTVSSSPGKNPFRVVPFVRPSWLFEDLDERRKDMLSKPFAYMSEEEISAVIEGPPPRPRGRPKKKKEENE